MVCVEGCLPLDRMSGEMREIGGRNRFLSWRRQRQRVGKGLLVDPT